MSVDREKFVRMWAEGATNVALAAACGISAGSVRNYATKFGLGKRGPRDPRSGRGGFVDRARFEALWLGGASNDELIEALGITRSYISVYAAKHGLGWRGQGRAAADPVARPVEVARVDFGGDAELLETGGRYRALARWADKRGVTLLQAQQAWHRARAKGV